MKKYVFLLSYLDELSVNGHPVWLKEGMSQIWDDHYIWLKVNHSAANHPWKWVLGTDYLDDTSIEAECLLPTNEYISDPTQCGNNWYNQFGDRIDNLTSTDGICDLADSYVCTSSGSGFFNYYFAGRYRQVHEGVPMWFSSGNIGTEGDLNGDAFIGINFVNETFHTGWAFVIAYASAGSIYAICPLHEPFTTQDVMSPWACNDDWYTIEQFEWGTAWIWDPLMDIDQCQHPNSTSVTTAAPIVYPEALCMYDDTNAYSQFQSLVHLH